VLASAALSFDAHADILVGGITGTDLTVPSPVERFADDASGAAVALGSFYTNAGSDQMLTPTYLTYEPVEDVVYVSDFRGQAIRVYKRLANGNATALRVLNPPSLGQPRQSAISIENNELIVPAGGCCVATYSSTASGANVAALRTLQWGGGSGSVTRLNRPSDVALRKSSDEIIVSDSSAGAGVLLFFDRTSDGNTAPTRTIEGAATELGSVVVAVAYDSAHDEIFAVSSDGTSWRIVTFPGTASGNVVPTRDIEGSLTGLLGTASIAYDAKDDLIYVAGGGFSSYPAQLLGFARTDSGNVAPVREIVAGGSLPTQPNGIAFVSDTIFADGFE
jgi:hypothetical protein